MYNLPNLSSNHLRYSTFHMPPVPIFRRPFLSVPTLPSPHSSTPITPPVSYFPSKNSPKPTAFGSSTFLPFTIPKLAQPPSSSLLSTPPEPPRKPTPPDVKISRRFHAPQLSSIRLPPSRKARMEKVICVHFCKIQAFSTWVIPVYCCHICWGFPGSTI